MYTIVNNLFSSFDSALSIMSYNPVSIILSSQSVYSDLSKYMVIGLTVLIILGAGISVYNLFNSLISKREEEIKNTHSRQNK